MFESVKCQNFKLMFFNLKHLLMLANKHDILIYFLFYSSRWSVHSFLSDNINSYFNLKNWSNSSRISTSSYFQPLGSNFHNLRNYLIGCLFSWLPLVKFQVVYGLAYPHRANCVLKLLPTKICMIFNRLPRLEWTLPVCSKYSLIAWEVFQSFLFLQFASIAVQNLYTIVPVEEGKFSFFFLSSSGCSNSLNDIKQINKGK